MTTPEQLPFELGHRHAYEREDFWVSGSNREAVAWLDKWPGWTAPALILFGPPASGKTHLLQVWKKEASATEILPQNLLSSPADKLLGASKAVMIDNVSQVISRPKAQETLFHLITCCWSGAGICCWRRNTRPARGRFYCQI